MWRKAGRVWQWRNERVKWWGRDIRGQKVSRRDNTERARTVTSHLPPCLSATTLPKQTCMVITWQHINTTPNTYLNFLFVWHLFDQQELHPHAVQQRKVSLCSISSTFSMFKKPLRCLDYAQAFTHKCVWRFLCTFYHLPGDKNQLSKATAHLSSTRHIA